MQNILFLHQDKHTMHNVTFLIVLAIHFENMNNYFLFH